MTGIREQWSAEDSTLGAWLSVGSSVMAEGAARLGFDYVCVDNQHGGNDYQVSLAMIQAIVLGGSTRSRGCRGTSRASSARCSTLAPSGSSSPWSTPSPRPRRSCGPAGTRPLGARSFGPLMAGLRTGRLRRDGQRESRRDPDDRDRRSAGQPRRHPFRARHRRHLRRPGRSLAHLGLPPGNNDDEPRFTEALEAIVAGCRRHGVVPGIHSNGPLAARRLEQGFRMITVAADMVAARTHMAAELAQARGTVAGATPEPCIERRARRPTLRGQGARSRRHDHAGSTITLVARSRW